MQFCDECGSMMHVTEKRSVGSQNSRSSDDADDGEMVCASCGHSVPKDETLSEQYTSTEAQDDSDVIETSEDANFEGKPTATDVKCDECGHTEAWYTIKQTGAADEPPTRFFKCQACGYRWREYN